MSETNALLAELRVLPVVTALDVPSTLKLAAALQRGGMRAIEVTLRTPAALDSIRALKDAGSSLQIAAGTITDSGGMERALAAGADFLVSPGSTQALLQDAREGGALLIPGVSSASDVMLGLSEGYRCFKLFPAAAVGGLALLKSLAGPFPEVTFCPTGGLGPDNYLDYLALPNVLCCGGSWMCATALVENGDWQTIESLAQAAMQAVKED
ncbi:MAG: bifunctional 4-hydroxy-2-oxoglutarate aldolase/2-dehydro-3-deoxy-phosphogluconate aldolase [Pseudomonadota bacterium]